ncbi:hypothetical protein C8J57DRAFT_1644674 [Mycena rebaudengoi]|nr:hypothetical protein C8J57DRAFT_1558562 [Mycena rebaudengoi]KAJ7258677.1 hypothetical protein C8J57DRAFT_1644674 [Mycena rebaudengoi]
MISLLFLVHTLSGRNLDSRATAFTDTCDDINNCRKLFDIVWGCLITIFACTWISVHPNVPPPNQGPLALLWRRLKMMLVAIIAPEVMVGFAARQFFIARWYAKEHKISKTHGFFISMGGFVSHVGHHPVTTPDNVPKYLDTICVVDVEDINDKSKGDALSKGIAFAQGAWFMTQCFARLAQKLPVSELEITTLAFAVVNVFIWLLWWNKPLDVQRPIMVVPVDDQHPISPLRSQPEEDGWSPIMGILNGGYKSYEPAVHTSVPSFWSSSLGKEAKGGVPFYIECLVGTIFGAIHCAAWNADFSSTVEMLMWISCALSVTAIPLIMALCYAADNMGLFQGASCGGIFMAVFFYLAILIYLISRLFLIIHPLIALRAPAAGLLMDVNWSVYIPHL